MRGLAVALLFWAATLPAWVGVLDVATALQLAGVPPPPEYRDRYYFYPTLSELRDFKAQCAENHGAEGWDCDDVAYAAMTEFVQRYHREKAPAIGVVYLDWGKDGAWFRHAVNIVVCKGGEVYLADYSLHRVMPWKDAVSQGLIRNPRTMVF